MVRVHGAPGVGPGKLEIVAPLPRVQPYWVTLGSDGALGMPVARRFGGELATVVQSCSGIVWPGCTPITVTTSGVPVMPKATVTLPPAGTALEALPLPSVTVEVSTVPPASWNTTGTPGSRSRYPYTVTTTGDPASGVLESMQAHPSGPASVGAESDIAS